MTTSTTMTNHLSVLPAAIEAAQRVAAETVAAAVAAAEAAGYERGRREASAQATTQPQAQAAPDGLLALLVKAIDAADDAEALCAEIDGQCDNLAAETKRHTDVVTVPDTGDSFDDVATFLSDYAGQELVDVDDVQVDSDEIRNSATNTIASLHSLKRLLADARAMLAPPPPATSETEESAAAPAE
jgi:hypothetical protein